MLLQMLAVSCFLNIVISYPSHDNAPQQCGPNEVWVQCTTCEEECKKHLIPCISACFRPSCMCQPGYVRYQKQCLPASVCGRL
uniref:TIL domain-containing protein n=1 Tax=Steinernema glaseri TaxID=37863 RepID=A0A1I7YTU7_9BILA